jgi:replication initiation protein RepC
MSERRITAAMLEVRDRADGFAGLPPREARPDRFLSAFQEAEPYLHLPIHAYKLVTWLVKQTRPSDWQSGCRPVVWPTRRRQCELLGISPGQVKLLNRALFAAGILVIRDVAGRAANGNEARYGLDLTPLAQRCAEFERLAQTADRERARVELLRQRAPVAARAFRQAGAALARLNALPAEWPRLEAEVTGLVTAARRDVWPDEIGSIVERLEDRAAQAEKLVHAVNPSQQPARTRRRPRNATIAAAADQCSAATAPKQGGGGSKSRAYSALVKQTGLPI